MKKYLKELWTYRKIIYQLVMLSFKTQFRQSFIGPLWHIIQPLISSGVLLIIFREILGTAVDLKNPYLTFFSAIIFWNIFLQSFSTSALIFESNKGIFSKIYFPRIIPIISNSGVNFFRFLLQIILYFIIYYLTESTLSIEKITAVLSGSLLLFIHITLLGMGTGMILASISVVYKDLLILIPFISNLLFFASPIVYEMQNIQSQIKKYIILNPLVAPIQSAKDLLQHQFEPDLFYLFSLIAAVFIFLLSGFIFTHAGRRFVDTI